RESGLGRYDILMRPRDIRKRGIIMELKVCDLDYGETVESTLASALQQIEDKHYEATLRAAGVDDILKMAITFDGKQVWVKSPEK
ncbi:MAG: PD-(D/E)XK nuclease domain-containing protein, partial [Tannerellaceae bacterium]